MIYELERTDELLRERNWTRYRLAREMNDSPTSLNNMFHRPSTPGIPMIRRICRALGITIEEFYLKDGEMMDLTPQQTDLVRSFALLDAEERDRALTFIKKLAQQEP